MRKRELTLMDRFLKRSFDLIMSLIGLVALSWVIVIAFVLATASTRRNGFFTQTRVGKNGKNFKVIKIRTMKPIANFDTFVTADGDPRITRMGSFLRKTKLDELPQLINVFLGEMSFVGPRPDVPGLADQLKGEDRQILTLRPGITGPATLKYRNEEFLLAQQEDPEAHSRNVIYPDKVRLNREYLQRYRFRDDIVYIFKTIFERS